MELPARRLVLVFVVVSGLLGLYVLCVSRQIQVPWHMATLARFRPTAADATRSPFPASSSQDGALQGGDDSTTPTSESPLGATEDSSLPPKPPTTTTSTTTTTTRAATTTTPSRTTTDFFGDVRYASEDVPLQSSCPDSIRSRVSNSSFAGRFLPRLPVLQWSKHATETEYKRLRHYPGAHGWGGVTFPVLKASLSVLNTSANRVMFDDWPRRANGSQCIRCAVVGNGGILKDSKKGPEIDKHDYVFRTNGAVTGGFEQDVGSRTSFYTFSTNTLRNSMHSYHGVGYNGPPVAEETRYVFLPDHDRDYILMRASAMHTPIDTGPERTKTPPTYFGENPSVEKFKMYHPDFIRYLRNRFLRSSVLKGRYKDIYRPSTGAVMLLAALHTCDQVSAYGFMTPDYKNYSNHYYDRTFQAVGFYANHDYRLELDLWQQLRREGLLNLYMRQ